MRSATDYVDQQFPDIPIILIEAYPILDRLQVTESIDWIGFGHYFIKDPATNPDYQRELNIIKSKRTSTHQRMVVIMGSHYIPEIHKELAGIGLEDMYDVALNYYQLAKSDTLVIAMLG